MDYDVKKLLTAMQEANAKASNYEGHGGTVAADYVNDDSATVILQRAMKLLEKNNEADKQNINAHVWDTPNADDEVNHPSHYTHGTRETIDIIKDVTGDHFDGFLVGNTVKYISRYRYKGKPVEDLEKADWYLKRLISEMEDEQ